MKADHNTIMLFGVKVMSKYKVFSKRERGMTKRKRQVTVDLNVLKIINIDFQGF